MSLIQCLDILLVQPGTGSLQICTSVLLDIYHRCFQNTVFSSLLCKLVVYLLISEFVDNKFTMPGRKQDSVWIYFEKSVSVGKTGCRAKCKTCGKEMQGLVARLKQHYQECSHGSTPVEDSCINSTQTLDKSMDNLVQQARKRGASPSSDHNPSPAKKQKSDSSMDQFIMQTPASVKAAIDLQVARFIYATNSPFAAVEHTEFVKLIQMLRPGYKPLNRHDVGGKLLDQVQSSLMEGCKEMLQNQPVSMALDGWSNIHNEPVVCVSVTTPSGDTYLTETVDTSGNKHTADYLQEIAIQSIQSAENQFGCKVGSFVTDNASNMAKMRRNLDQEDNMDVISYGCSAHYMNLLAKDVEIPGVKDHVVQVMKYFRNSHLPSAWYKAAGGRQLVLPQEVRWNTLADCLQSYLDNWSTLLKVCEEHRDEIESSISDKVKNFGLKRNAEDYLQRMKPIAVALDKVQSDSCRISDAVDVWKQLESELSESQPSNIVKKVQNRSKQALTPAHYLANILDPGYCGHVLSEEEIDIALDYCHKDHPKCMSDIVNFRAKTGPFKPYMFSPDLNVSPLAWWDSLSSRIEPGMLQLCHQLLSAVASSAGVERIFSTFGLVHSKIRNRLGISKAGKLVFIYKLLNSKSK